MDQGILPENSCQSSQGWFNVSGKHFKTFNSNNYLAAQADISPSHSYNTRNNRRL